MPFYLTYGRDTRQPIQSNESVGKTMAQRAQNRQKQLHDRKIQNITEFGIGEKPRSKLQSILSLQHPKKKKLDIHAIIRDITSPVPSGVLVTPPSFVVLPPFAETHDLVESVDVTHTALLRAIRSPTIGPLIFMELTF
ncbi:8393_t:CDS:2 [Dentiscutata erythropus]|uniref:8393_t:CDS:1 n=1 Tax=Dentiscutata erythropus TaxID=1348616 RepID=A0A9N8W2A0_9GLOM|nr:8393_t:CDS:2 [Dentiscutata erythropus]